MMCQHAREAIAASWLAELEPASEAALKRHLNECAECAAEMAALTPVWERLADLPAPEPSPDLDMRWRATLQSLMPARTAPEPRRRPWALALRLAAAASFAVLIIGLVTAHREIGRLENEISSTRAMVAVSMLQQKSATERLRGVDYSGRMPRLEPEVVSALVRAVNADPSVNVRLAAIDALSRTAGNRGVLQELTRSIPTQDSPMVQAALVDYLADAHDVEAIPALRQLAGAPGVNPAVAERTRSALRDLGR